VYAVLFDIDGTLIHTSGAGHLAFAETFAEEFGITEISASVPFAGRSDRAIAGELMSVHGVEATDESWQRFRSAYLKRLPSALERRDGRVLPGVVALLDALAKMPEAAVGLLTGNVSEGAQAKLNYYGLGSRFAFGGFGDEATDRNVIAAIALAEAQRHAMSPLRGSMVIGDTVHDIRCARAIDAVAVAVPTGGATAEELAAEQPDVLLQNLSDARQLLQLVREARAA
jgi:phosphoglycolate phosphatase